MGSIETLTTPSNSSSVLTISKHFKGLAAAVKSGLAGGRTSSPPTLALRMTNCANYRTLNRNALDRVSPAN